MRALIAGVAAGLYDPLHCKWTDDGYNFIAQFLYHDAWIAAIESAVMRGERVIAGSPGYVVHGEPGRMLITFEPNGYTIGLTNRNVQVLNGSSFYIESPDGATKQIGYGYQSDFQTGSVTITSPDIELSITDEVMAIVRKEDRSLSKTGEVSITTSHELQA
ncbi:hypothetical protein [Reinekea sp. G2M2-21]|uniref:hypothetical protein n=1 Tax=Reinekea sp. G2M2-21 TaxID=2788942 RepID=UPI0018A9BC87|nr:hypothetical protein [Reinekea sp. G2M2-21]